MNIKYERQLKKGVLDIVVLDLLNDQSMYGYQIILEMKKRSRFLSTMKEGTLYPLLYRLEDDGYIQSEWSQAQDKVTPKKYYTITSQGQKELTELKQFWFAFSNEISKILGEK